MGTLEKTYSCKFCSMGFSSGRVLGGHVRRHLAVESSAARDKKSPIVTEKSEVDDNAVDGVHEQGGHFLRTNPKKSAKSLGSNEREIDYSSGKNLCGSYRKGFRVGTGTGGRRRERDDDGMPYLVLGTEVKATSKKSLLEDILRGYERIYPTIRRKRSIRARRNGNLSGKNVVSDTNTASSLLLSGGIHEDEMEAAISLLTISVGVRNWESSAVGNESLKNGSSMDEIVNVEGVSDAFSLGISNQRRRVYEVDDVGLEIPKLPDCVSSFSTYTNVEEKSIEHEVSLYVTSGGVEVRSRRKGDVVEEIESMVVDVLEGERLPNLISDDEVGGDHSKKKKKLSDPHSRKTALVFKRTGYKCKNCRNIFPTYQALECHRAKHRNRTSCCSSPNSEKSKNVVVNGDVSSPSPANEVNKTLSTFEVCTQGKL